MVRIIIKGGVWKNTEDEVLKAAIAKYGKNQWARISSLLVRKTPKQCKARWYEWLDPSIKKTEWSKTEDEKLLHLAKLMPTQWRTIAPIVGRTATQCLERYQKLLDDAEAKENEELGLAGPSDHGPSADDVRRLRPGEIDPDPETKPARPDPIDMDEDEKEMLSEARARLANTQGKKAKRKARERQLEEARRLAVLQKKRELKAAGIIMRSKTKVKGMDYNADIPFEKKPAPGFYDTSEEQAKVIAPPVGQTLRRLENKRKPSEAEVEAEKRKRQKRDDANAKEHQTKFIAARDAQIQKLKEAESITRRRKLVLPEAQVGERELEEIVKIGRDGESARALVNDGSSDATGGLLTDYGPEGLDAARMARTPRTEAVQDNIMAEARNLRNMTMAQTPLLGDENTPLHNRDSGTGFESATPRHQVAVTPNPLATPLRQLNNGDLPEGTPRRAGSEMTPMRTPRDNLSINPADEDFTPQTPRGQVKSVLQAAFSSLPKPENNFEVVVPDQEDDVSVTADSKEVEEDAAERDARLQRVREEEERKALARRSLAIKRNLPRPPAVDVPHLVAKLSVEASPVDKLIAEELSQLVLHDALTYPLPGTPYPGSTQSTYVIPEDEYLDEAQKAITQELATLVGFPSASVEQVKEGLEVSIDKDDFNSFFQSGNSWAATRQRLVYSPQNRTWVDADSISLEERIEGYKANLTGYSATMSSLASKATKAEKKLGITLGGYITRAQALGERLIKAYTDMQEEHRNLVAFERLRAGENVIGPRRVQALREEVQKLEKREKVLQERYAELDGERRDVEKRVTELEEKMMEEAEMLNEQALRDMEATES